MNLKLEFRPERVKYPTYPRKLLPSIAFQDIAARHKAAGMSDSDPFEDDDFDFDTIVANAEKIQKLQHTQQHLNTQLPNTIDTSNSDTTTAPTLRLNTQPQPNPIAKHSNTNAKVSADEVYEVRGENAILKNQIARLQKEQGELQAKIKLDFERSLKDKEAHIQALNENLVKSKSENEFLVSEVKGLQQSISKRRKIRAIEQSAADPSETSSANTTSNTSAFTQQTQYQASDHIFQDTQLPKEKEEVNVVVLNQATVFQDEKTLFIETISNYVIPGMTRSTFSFLESIQSSFDDHREDFNIAAKQNSLRSSILKFLIGFQDKNRIDNLLMKFIDTLLHHVERTGNALLPVPHLLALVNFSINYRPKALSESFIGTTTAQIVKLMLMFQHLYKPEYDYLALPRADRMISYYATQREGEGEEMVDYMLMAKPMHDKILEVFTAIYLMDILTSLSKVSSFHVITSTHSGSSAQFWKQLPQQLVINSFLSRKTPIHFVYSTVDILINSIIDDDRFAFANTRQNGVTRVKDANEVTTKLLEQCMQFLLTVTPEHIHFNVYGLNRMIGSNRQLKLLDIVSIPEGELSFEPRTNSFDAYGELLKNDYRDYQDQEFHCLKTKLLILDLFEAFYSTLIMIKLPTHTNMKLLKVLIQLIGEEEEFLFRNARGVNNGLRVEVVSKSVKIIHYLISEGNHVKMSDITSPHYRDMVIVLLKISANSMKNLSMEFVTKLRLEGYRETIFNSTQERRELDKFGLWDSLLVMDKIEDKEEVERLIKNRIQVETDIYNGVDFNFPDETIDLARDIVELSITVDEADNLYESINYLFYEERDEDYDMGE